jgi:hypothetical protein
LFEKLPQLDTELAQKIIRGNDQSRRYIEKCLAKNQGGLRSLLQPEELVQAVTSSDDINGVLVVSNLRLLRLKKGKHSWAPIALEDVAETQLATRDTGKMTKYMVTVETFASKQYAESDRRKFDPAHFFMVTFDDPQPAQATAVIIDAVVAQQTGRVMK